MEFFEISIDVSGFKGTALDTVTGAFDALTATVVGTEIFATGAGASGSAGAVDPGTADADDPGATDAGDPEAVGTAANDPGATGTAADAVVDDVLV